MLKYWTPEEKEKLEKISSFEEAADLAVNILSRMNEEGKEVVQLCGPMSTGGAGNLALNMERFQKAVDKAAEKGLLVFDQVPFQNTIIRLCELREDNPEYNWEILDIFYKRIFESGHVKRALFLPGWEKSVGASWERDLVTKLGLVVEEYPLEWLN